MRGRGTALIGVLVVGAAIALVGCGNGSADRPAARSTSTTAGTVATTARIVPASNTAPTVTDAPQEAVTEQSDTSGYFITGPNRAEGSTRGAEEYDDPLDFVVTCEADDDGHGRCMAELTNNVTRVAQFPGGLEVVVTLDRVGGEQTRVVLAPEGVSVLRPGETAQVEGAFEIPGQGHYNYEATTTVAWP